MFPIRNLMMKMYMINDIEMLMKNAKIINEKN